MRVLKRGMTSPEVGVVQRRLQALGYVGADGKQLVADNVFGANTEHAVRAFQRDQRILVDGKVGPATWSLLNDRPIEPLQPEDPAKRGLLVNGKLVPVPGVRVINRLDAAWAHLAIGDHRARRREPNGQLVWVRQWLLHKTIAENDERVVPGKGPPGGARKTLDWWTGDPKYSGTHLVTGDDGEVGCFADLVLVEAFHAGRHDVNRWSVGHETRERLNGDVFEAALEATVTTYFVGCAAVGIQLQTHRGPYRGRPMARFASSPHDAVGVFGHRDVTDQRDKRDPGDELFRRGIARGMEAFDFERRQDVEVWKARQRELVRVGHRIPVDGVAGPATVAALKLEGYRDGIWALGRANYHGD